MNKMITLGVLLLGLVGSPRILHSQELGLEKPLEQKSLKKIKGNDLPVVIEWESVSTFSSNTDVLTKSALDFLQKVAEKLVQMSDETYILIDTQAKDFQDPVLNLNLAIARAMAIEEILSTHGIEKKRIYFSGQNHTEFETPVPQLTLIHQAQWKKFEEKITKTFGE
ncbi:MAG: OmpA family protein [Bdellovibrionota bacterium]